MSIDDWKKVAVWPLYIPAISYVLYLSLPYTGTNVAYLLDYGLFLILFILISLFPIRTHDAVYSLINGVSLAALISFGLIPEMILSSIAILSVLIRSSVKLDQHYRYPINLLLTLIISVLTALTYYSINELLDIKSLVPLSIVPMGVYLLTYSLINQLAAVFVGKVIYGLEKVQFFDDHLKFSLRTSTIVLPLSFILVYLYSELGSIGIFLGAFPFVTTSIVTKYYYKSRSNNMILTEVTRFSQMLAAKETRAEVVDGFMEYLLKIFPSEQIYYFRMTKGKYAVLDRVHTVTGVPKSQLTDLVLTEESLLMNAFKENRTFVFENAAQWGTNTYFNPFYQPESAVVLPVRLMGKDKGLLVITHSNRAIYDEFLVNLIEIFYQYFRVVLDKAYQFELLENSNYTDFLTDLPNLKGFAKHIEHIAADETLENLSLIVMDLDHFKKINDAYGHEAGNDVLMQVADVIRQSITNNCYAARFGGEEFVIVCRDLSKEEAFKLAEKIRVSIKETIFKAYYSIETQKEADVRITASIGLATYPDDAKDIHDLVKLADRAMYLGSKQNGRNKTTQHRDER